MYDILTVLASVNWNTVEAGLARDKLPGFYKFRVMLSQVMTQGTSFFETEGAYDDFITVAQSYAYTKPRSTLN